MNKRFEGDLKSIDPELLINPDQQNKIESFFVTLGTIFNEINSIIVFEKMLEDFYEKPKPGEESVHAGHYGGLKVYIQKMLASTIHEFFDFLNKNADVLDEEEFKNILFEIPKSNQELWGNLVLASTGSFDKVSGLLDSILKTRNNIGFHFDRSGKSIRNAFMSRFFREDKSEKNNLAYYSLGNILETRFYFSDASEEEILYLNAGKKKGDILKDNAAWIKYEQQIIDTVHTMAETISALLKKYVGRRRNRPR